MSPTESAFNSLHRIKTENIPKNSFALFDDFYENENLTRQDIFTKILLLRKNNGDLIAFIVATKGNKILVPTDHYWNGGYSCDDFSPNFSGGFISCKKTVSEKIDLLQHKWSLEGISLTGSTQDLDRLQGVEKNGFFEINRK